MHNQLASRVETILEIRAYAGNLGVRAYGLGAVGLGLVGLVWGDFARLWQPITALPFLLPHATAVAYIVALGPIAGGLALQWSHTAAVGSVALAFLYFLFNAMLWVPRVIANPRIYGTWAGFFEQLSLVAAGLIAYALSVPQQAERAAKIARTSLFLYALCVVSYALEHFSAIPQTAEMVPKWMPPGQRFWAITTGLAFLIAGLAILSGYQAVLASRLLALMLFAFGALVWAPGLVPYPRSHNVWAGNAISVAFFGAALVVADAVTCRQRANLSNAMALSCTDPASGQA